MMLKKLLYSAIATILIACSSSFLLTQYIVSRIKTEAAKLSNNITIDNTKITFEKINSYYAPTLFGIKIEGLKLTDSNTITEFSAPLILGMNLWNLNLVINYNGASDYKSQGKKYHATIDADILGITDIKISKLRILLRYPLSFLSNIMKVKYNINNFTIEEDGKELIKNKSHYTITLKHHSSYKSLGDLKNKLPQNFAILGEMKSTNNLTYDVMPLFFRAIIPPTDFSGTFALKLNTKQNIGKSNNILKLIANSQIGFRCMKCESSVANFTVTYDQDFQSERKELVFDIDFQLKNGFLEKLEPIFASHMKESHRMRVYIIQNLIDQLKCTADNIDYSSHYNIKHNGIYNVSDRSLHATINNLMIKSSQGPGFGISGKTDSKLTSGDLDIFIFKAKDMVEFVGDFGSNFYHYPMHDALRSFTHKVNYDFLKSISEHPDSESEDLQLKLKYNNNNLTISHFDHKGLSNQYFMSKTKIIRNEIVNQKNPTEYLKSVAPEALPYINEFLDTKEPKQE